MNNKKKSKYKKNQIKYKKAFPRRFRNLLWLLNVGFLIACFKYATMLSPEQQPASEMWTDAGRWTTGVVVAPFVALAATYVWMRSKVRSWPRGPNDPVSWAFALSGLFLVVSIVVLTINPITESGDWENCLAVLGVVMPLGSGAFQIIGLLTILRTWDTLSDRTQRRGSK